MHQTSRPELSKLRWADIKADIVIQSARVPTAFPIYHWVWALDLKVQIFRMITTQPEGSTEERFE
jgi:hypothetical protein